MRFGRRFHSAIRWLDQPPWRVPLNQAMDAKRGRVSHLPFRLFENSYCGRSNAQHWHTAPPLEGCQTTCPFAALKALFNGLRQTPGQTLSASASFAIASVLTKRQVLLGSVA